MGSKRSQQEDPYRFPGFIAPQYTSVPDIVFDELMSRLSGAELKVLMYIIRRTFGFKKNADDISYSQMLKGIRTRDGVQLDAGAGINSRTTLSKAIQRLSEMEIIEIIKNSSAEHGNEATTYRLNMGSTRQPSQREMVKTNPSPKNGLGSSRGGPKNGLGANSKSGPGASPQNEPALVHKMDPQNKAQQNTEKQKTDVVALLAAWGMNRRVAQRLGTEHSLAEVEEKISYLEYLLVAEPERVQSPIGWLRRAIEQNFSAPQGFKSVEELAAEQARQQVIEQERHARQLALEATTALRTERLYAAYSTSDAEKELWQDVLSALEQTLYAEAFEHLRASLLLQGRGSKFVVWIEDSRAREIVAGRLATRIKQELARCGVEGEIQLTFADNVGMENKKALG